MEIGLVVLAIFGCTEDFNDCTKVEAAVMEFTSRAECVRQIDETLNQSTNLPFPVITARCDPAKDEPLVASADLLTTGSAIR